MNTIQQQWSNLHKRLKDPNVNAKERVFIKRNIDKLKPQLQAEHSAAQAQAQSKPVEAQSKPVEAQSKPVSMPVESWLPFNFFMVPGSPAALSLVDQVYAQWRAFHTFKRALPAGRLNEYRQIIAGVVCNLLYAKTANSQGVFLSREKATLGKASRYRPQVFNRRLLTILDDLHSMGLIHQTVGQRYPHDNGKSFRQASVKYRLGELAQTQLSTTPKLKALRASAGCTKLEDILIQTDKQEVVMLKKDDGSGLAEYQDSPLTEKYRRQMRIINAMLDGVGSLLTPEAPAELYDQRRRFLQRKFTYGSFEKGGRLWGGFWQHNMKRVSRPHVLRLKGEKTAEIDFNSIIVHLAYALHGDDAPAVEDQYAIPGLHPESRPGIKKLMGALLFRESTRKQFPKEKDSKGNKESILKYFHISDRSKSYVQVYNCIAKQHPSLVDFFGTGVGHHLQFLESRVLVNVLLACIQKKIPCLPLHDCLIVPESKAERVLAIMELTSFMVLGREIPASRK